VQSALRALSRWERSLAAASDPDDGAAAGAAGAVGPVGMEAYTAALEGLRAAVLAGRPAAKLPELAMADPDAYLEAWETLARTRRAPARPHARPGLGRGDPPATRQAQPWPAAGPALRAPTPVRAHERHGGTPRGMERALRPKPSESAD
jgi:hypothetical protein